MTGSPEEVEADAAALTGTADSNSGEAEYFFEYGPTISYGHIVEGEAIGHEVSGSKVKNYAVNLRPETSYDFQLVTLGAAGPTYGVNHSFTMGKRIESVEEEAERKAANESFEVTKSADAGAGKSFFGMMWSGDVPKMGEIGPYTTIAATKAHQVRVVIFPEGEAKIPTAIEGAVAGASAEGLEVVPYFGSGPLPQPGKRHVWLVPDLERGDVAQRRGR